MIFVYNPFEYYRHIYVYVFKVFSSSQGLQQIFVVPKDRCNWFRRRFVPYITLPDSCVPSQGHCYSLPVTYLSQIHNLGSTKHMLLRKLKCLRPFVTNNEINTVSTVSIWRHVHRMGWGVEAAILLGSYSVWIPAESPVILRMLYCGSPQSLTANGGKIIDSIRPRPFPSKSFPIRRSSFYVPPLYTLDAESVIK
jgi:hypothetical protein